MDEQTNKQHNEFDIIGLFLLLWSKKKQIIINCFIGGVLAIIVAFSIPKQFTSTAVLAPEMASSANIGGGGIGALASMAGVNIGALAGGSEDALYPELYPQIVSSTPFLCDLMKIEVTSKDGELHTNMYDYLINHQRSPWWSEGIKATVRWVKRLMGKVEEELVMPEAKEMNLSRKQLSTLQALSDRISVSVDKGNNVITLKVTMQDPVISAYMTECVNKQLQDYIGQYRSMKARKDLAYVQQLYKESQSKYYAAQQEYATYVDQHQGLVRKQYQIEQDRLQNEQDLAFNVYNQVAQQLEMARAKVEESTPVCVVMQPAIVPYKASSPKKMMMGLLYVFMAFFGTVAWYIVKNMIIERDAKNA